MSICKDRPFPLFPVADRVRHVASEERPVDARARLVGNWGLVGGVCKAARAMARHAAGTEDRLGQDSKVVLAFVRQRLPEIS